MELTDDAPGARIAGGVAEADITTMRRQLLADRCRRPLYGSFIQLAPEPALTQSALGIVDVMRRYPVIDHIKPCEINQHGSHRGNYCGPISCPVEISPNMGRNLLDSRFKRRPPSD